MVYGGINRVDWRTVSPAVVTTTAEDVDTQLVPMLRQSVRPARHEVAVWTTDLVRETQQLLATVLPLSDAELAFLEALNGAGEIHPELLTTDADEHRVIAVTGAPKQPKSGEFGPTAKPSPLGSGVATLRPFDLKPSLALGCLTQAKGLALDFNDLADMG